MVRKEIKLDIEDVVFTYEKFIPEAIGSGIDIKGFREKNITPENNLGLNDVYYGYSFKKTIVYSEKDRLIKIPQELLLVAASDPSVESLREVSKHFMDPLKPDRVVVDTWRGEVVSYLDLVDYLNSLGAFLIISARELNSLNGTIQRNMKSIFDALKSKIGKIPNKLQVLDKVKEVEVLLEYGTDKDREVLNPEAENEVKNLEKQVEKYSRDEKGKIDELRIVLFEQAKQEDNEVLTLDYYIEKATEEASFKLSFIELMSILNTSKRLPKIAEQNVVKVLYSLVDQKNPRFFQIGEKALFLATSTAILARNIGKSELSQSKEYFAKVLKILKESTKEELEQRNYAHYPRVISLIADIEKHI